MGTVCAIAATASPAELRDVRRAIDAAKREVATCEHALSRFDAHSDLSRLNDANGAWLTVGSRLVEALGLAVRARADTDGMFDPTILPAVVAAGYDRSFELLTDRETRPLDDWCAGALIDIDADSMRVRIAQGAAVDLGGIGKGYAATRALGAMRAAWPALTGGLVDLGGDIGVWGNSPEGGPWRVDITDPRADDRVVGTLELTDGGVATSGRDARRFGPGGARHHLIDPATGTSAVAGPLSVTVVAASATEAETHATALALMDVGASRSYLAARQNLAALLIPQVGEPIAVGRLPLTRERRKVRIALTTEAGGSSWHR